MSTIPVQTILQWALEIERNGEAFYRAAAAAAQDREVHTLFSDLAYQEQRHYRTFERMLARAPEIPPDIDVGDYVNYMRTALADALVGPDKGLERARLARTEEQALRAAMAFEKDTLLFFYEVADWVAPEQKATLRAIIDEERDHLRQLSRVLESGPWVA